MLKIVLEDRFNTTQKVLFVFVFAYPLFNQFNRYADYGFEDSSDYLVFIALLFLYAILVGVAFLKRGFAVINSQLYRGSFLLNRLVLKTKIDLSGKSKVSVLSFQRGLDRHSSEGLITPEESFEAYDICVLDESHIKREEIIMLKQKENIEPLIDFLTSNFELTYEKYNPKISRSSRRRRR